MRAVIIPSDEGSPVRIEDVPEIDLEFLQRTVGGYVERVALDAVGGGGGLLSIYLNEDGKRMRLPYNPRATALAWNYLAISRRDYMVGDVVILGAPDEDGEEAGLDAEGAAWVLAQAEV